MQLDPALALLHIGIEKFPLSYGIVMIHVLEAAKTVIARLWKNNLGPDHFR